MFFQVKTREIFRTTHHVFQFSVECQLLGQLERLVIGRCSNVFKEREEREMEQRSANQTGQVRPDNFRRGFLGGCRVAKEDSSHDPALFSPEGSRRDFHRAP